MNVPTIATSIQDKAEPILKKAFSPASLSKLLKFAPMTLNRIAIESALNFFLNENLIEKDFEFLEDRSLKIVILDAELELILSVVESRFKCLYFGTEKEQRCDSTLSIDTADAIKLVQQEVDPDTLFFKRKLKISGDTELAHHVKNTIDTLSPDKLPRILKKLMQEYDKRVLR